jgi:hypothetical protein
MKKVILVHGTIAGAIVSLMLIIGFSIMLRNGGEHMDLMASMVVNYATQFLAMSMIFVGIRNYKMKFLGGRIGFWRAWGVGMLIALLASTMYLITWTIMYKFFTPDFLDKYATQAVQEMIANGDSQEKITQAKEEMQEMAAVYKTVPGFIAYTYAEIIPTGVFMSLISAIVFSIKKKKNSGDADPVTQS